MKRVLHIVKQYRGNYPLLNQITSVNALKFNSAVCYLKGSDDGANQVTDNGTETFYLNSSGSLGMHRIDIARRLAALIDELSPDCVVCHLEKTIFLAAMAKRFCSSQAKFVGVIHGLVGGDKMPLKRKLKSLVSFGALDKIISVSESGVEDVVEQFWNIKPDRVCAIQNGIDLAGLERELAPEIARQSLPQWIQKRFLFGTVGRLAPKKNHATLIRAFAEVCRARNDVALVIIGDGPLKMELVQLADSLGLGEHVHFTGQRSDVPQLLRALDVFVFPSWREGLPFSLLEAMASSVTPLASDIPCVREVIDSSKIGYLVHPGNGSGWADAMIKLSTMPTTELKNMANASRERIEQRFSHSRMIEDYERLFTELCA